jgi:hypothetical protein
LLAEADLLEHLKARFTAIVIVLYGSAASGQLTLTSDVDIVCFRDGDERFPESYVWNGWQLDVWIHPIGDADRAADFAKLHDGRIVLDHLDVGRRLLDAVTMFLALPAEELGPKEKVHRRAWVWKMFDRAAFGGMEGDHRRHWLLHDLPETWCQLRQRHYLGPGNAFKLMRKEDTAAFGALEKALKAEATLRDVEEAVSAVVGAREF